MIFDCDGVLVDSEPISLAVLMDMLAGAGISIGLEEASSLFLGRSLASMVRTAEAEYGLAIDEAFLAEMRGRLYARFRAELRPTPGVVTALEALEAAGIEWCVASSSQPERIVLSLTVTGIRTRFDPRIFSASMVERGKPAPDLFLHAAAAMGRAPAECVVIEDSPAGIMAARAAGMRVLAYTGGSHTGLADYQEELERLKPETRFDAMADLLHLVLPAGRPRDNPDA